MPADISATVVDRRVVVTAFGAAALAPILAQVEAAQAGLSQAIADAVAAAGIGIFGTTWIVAPDGTASGAGTRASPLSLEKAGALDSPVQPGDLILLRGGTYNPVTQLVSTSKDLGFRLRKAGEAGKPITLQAYPGETPVLTNIIDTSAGWTRTIDEPGRQVWESNFTVVGTTHWMGGHVVIGGKPYPLTYYRYNNSAAILATNSDYRSDGAYYVGPGVMRQASGKLLIRLDPPYSASMLGLPIAAPASTDPAAVTLRLWQSSWQVMRAEAPHLVIDGLQYQDGYELLHIETSSVEVKNCNLRVGCIGIAGGAAGNSGWDIHDNIFDACMWSDGTNWIGWGDIKNGAQPADNNKTHLLSPGLSASGRAYRNRFRNAFDGTVMGTAGWEFGSYGDTPLPTSILREAAAWANANRWDNIWDDALQIYSACQGLKVHHNYFMGGGVSRDSSTSATDRGSDWPAIHHNVFNARAYKVFYNRRGRNAAAGLTGIGNSNEEGRFNPPAISNHGAGVWDFFWKFYHNTVIYSDDPNTFFLFKSLMCQSPGAANRNMAGGPNLIANNLIIDNGVVTTRFRPLNGSRQYSNSGRNLLDGNAYVDENGPVLFFQLFTTSAGDVAANSIFTLAQLRGNATLLADTQVDYAPGWEASGLQFTQPRASTIGGNYRPLDTRLLTGAVDLSPFDLPGMDYYQPWRGAMSPLSLAA